MSDQPVPEVYRSSKPEHTLRTADGGVLYTVPHRILKAVWHNLAGPRPQQGTRLQNAWRQMTTRFADERWENLGLPELVDAWHQTKASTNKAAPQ